ncbi:hypothetical protein B4065_1365 [Caldibacillus thermoamylovorans]|nr:hypothetical protein B4065_1365 [Caldibacillus thermoamylovorans]
MSDTTLIIKTKKQYQAILEYRLKHFKPKGEKKKSSHNTRKPIRKELIPEYMKPGYETKTIDTMTPEERTEFEKKKKDLEKRLEKYKK